MLFSWSCCHVYLTPIESVACHADERDDDDQEVHEVEGADDDQEVERGALALKVAVEDTRQEVEE